MRYEAFHQHVKRKIEAMGFRNVLKTIPKIMNEARRDDIKKLSERMNPTIKKKSFIGIKSESGLSIFAVVDVSEVITVKEAIYSYNDKYLAFEIHSLKEPIVCNFEGEEIYFATECQVGCDVYAMFFDCLNL